MLTQAEVAARAGCCQQAISRIVRGGRPKRPLAKKLERVLGIPEDAWLTPAERAELEEFRKG